MENTELPKLYNQVKRLILLRKFTEGKEVATRALDSIQIDTLDAKQQEYFQALQRLALISSAQEPHQELLGDDVLATSRRLSTVGTALPTDTLLVVNALLAGETNQKRLEEAKVLSFSFRELT
jgi:hypothetical protein